MGGGLVGVGLAPGEEVVAAGEVEGVVAELGGLFEEVEEGGDDGLGCVWGIGSGGMDNGRVAADEEDRDVNLNDPRNPALLQGFFRTSRRGRYRPVKAAIVIRRHRQGHRCR